jgi:transposase
MTYSEFLELFPDNSACLNYLRDQFYPAGSDCPKCGKRSKFHRVKGRSAYACQNCGHHVFPTAGTIFEKSTTSLQLWFWAIFLMASTRCGISAKQLEREIGVSYHTAHRMFKEIRKLLRDDEDPLSGKVEMDETAYGGKPRLGGGRMTPHAAGGYAKSHKTTVFGAAERGGRVRVKVIPDRTTAELSKVAATHVLPSSMIFTDEWRPYERIGRRYASHRRVAHKADIYVDGDAHTQTIEGFFGLLKNGIRGVYHAVSREYLQSYLDEYAFRYNRRNSREPMFWAILERVQKRPASAA